MINKKTIEEVKRRLINTYQPIAIYLFGSYAWGSPDEESDLDILIIVSEFQEKPYDTLVKGHRVLGDLKISKDILVFTEQDFNQRANDVTQLSYKIKREGKKIYAKA